MTTTKTKFPGIRFKANTKKYLATKSIKGKREYKEFNTLKDAAHWKNTFIPLVPTTHQKPKLNDLDPTFRNIVERYQSEGMTSLTSYTKYKKNLRMNKFLPNLFNFRMSEITRGTLNEHIRIMKELVSGKSRRCNFDKELKDLSSIFNWYHDEIRHFENPVTSRHFKNGFIKEVDHKKKTMTVAEITLFVSQLKEPFKSLALLQFLLGTRVSEVSAINTEVVDMGKMELTLKDSIVWERGRPVFVKRNKTKTTTIKEITPMIRILLDGLRGSIPSGCFLYFNRHGKPLRYGQILENYNRALMKAGLTDFTGTHIMRHSMATFTRKEASLDTAQKMLSHQSSRQTEAYAKLDADKEVSEVVLMAEKALEENMKSVRPIATRQ